MVDVFNTFFKLGFSLLIFIGFHDTCPCYISFVLVSLDRDVLEKYTEEMKRVTELISTAMAKSLNLDENCFLRQFGGRSQLSARFNYYSPCKRPDLVLGLKPHSDGSGYTIIMQDEVGLQVLKDDKWFKVPKNPHSLLVLMADQMEVRNSLQVSNSETNMYNTSGHASPTYIFYITHSGNC